MATGLVKVAVIVSDNSSDDAVTDQHAQSSSHEEDSSAPAIDKENGWEREDKIDHAEHTSGK